jgi:hypothetical protein
MATNFLCYVGVYLMLLPVAQRDEASSEEQRTSRRWHLGSRRRLEDPARTEPVGWSYILFGCDPAELPDTSGVRERAVQTWLSDHGIVSTSS